MQSSTWNDFSMHQQCLSHHTRKSSLQHGVLPLRAQQEAYYTTKRINHITTVTQHDNSVTTHHYLKLTAYSRVNPVLFTIQYGQYRVRFHDPISCLRTISSRLPSSSPSWSSGASTLYVLSSGLSRNVVYSEERLLRETSPLHRLPL